MLTPPTVTDLATFTGRPEASFPPFAATALLQSTLLFSFVTGLKEYPADADLAQLAKFAILALADRLVLEQPYVATTNNPFSSETIGSYSYTKSNYVTSVTRNTGGDTGIWWWDLAVDKLAAASASLVASGYITADPLPRDGDGNLSVPDPVLVHVARSFGWDINAEIGGLIK